jgi:hypothetical protein
MASGMLSGGKLTRQRVLTRDRTRRWRARLNEKRLPDDRHIDRSIVDSLDEVLRKRALEDADATLELVLEIAHGTWRRLRADGVAASDVDLNDAVKKRMIGSMLNYRIR